MSEVVKTGKKGSSEYKPVPHVDATGATEVEILLDLIKRSVK